MNEEVKQAEKQSFEKPHGSYDDWKGSINTFYLSNGKVLQNVTVLDLWMTPAGPPHALTCLYLGKKINIPFERVMYYKILGQ